MLKLSLAKCEVPAFALRAPAGKLAPFLAAKAMKDQFDIGGPPEDGGRRVNSQRSSIRRPIQMLLVGKSVS